jgi:CheY-like chemotaxis protein
VRGTVRNFFATRTPFRCDEAEDGLSAIQTAEENHCELVVLDLAMPNLNGAVTASILRQRLPHVKIVAFSTLAGDPTLRHALLASKDFDAVLTKLDGLERLAQVVKALLPDPINR